MVAEENLHPLAGDIRREHLGQSSQRHARFVAQARETLPLPGLKCARGTRLRRERKIAAVVVPNPLAQFQVTPRSAKRSIHGFSSGGTACAVSWPPIQSVSSVMMTRSPFRAAASAAAHPPSPPPMITRSAASSCGRDWLLGAGDGEPAGSRAR